MIKLVCPCCGWSDFLKYDYDDAYHDTWYCLCCGLKFDKFRVFEKEVTDSEYDGADWVDADETCPFWKREE